MDKKKGEIIAQKKDKQNPHRILEYLLIAGIVVIAIVLFYDVASTPSCFRVGPSADQKVLYHIELLILLSVVVIAVSPMLRLNTRRLFTVLSILILFWFFIAFFGVSVAAPCPANCVFPAGIACVNDKLNPNLELDLTIGQGTGHMIKITGVVCTQNKSPDYADKVNINNYAADPIIINSGEAKIVSKSGTSHMVMCTDANGNTANLTNGIYDGRIYINFTEVETGIPRVTRGTFSRMIPAPCWEVPFSCIGEMNNILLPLLIVIWSILGIYLFSKPKQA